MWSAISGFLGSAAGKTAAAIAAPVLGGVLQNVSAKQQAQKQMDFQQQMSDTSYQRAMADMRKAGLNPILAGKLGGASTSSGAMAPVQNIGAGVPAAMQASSAVQLQNVQAKLVNFQARNSELDANIKELSGVPGATVSGFQDRLLSKLITHVEDYVNLAGSTNMFDNTQVDALRQLMTSLKAQSLELFRRTVSGIDMTTRKSLSAFDWFNDLIGGNR